jgi:hypothetical protein
MSNTWRDNSFVPSYPTASGSESSFRFSNRERKRRDSYDEARTQEANHCRHITLPNDAGNERGTDQDQRDRESDGLLWLGLSTKRFPDSWHPREFAKPPNAEDREAPSRRDWMTRDGPLVILAEERWIARHETQFTDGLDLG